ncbi:MAG: hypothetical protein V3V44_00610 [Anaerolineales bacterium]|jgi:hypothetical protein
MTIPSLLLGLLLASASGFLFHLIRGGRVSRLLLYLLTAWGAFFIGHLIGELLEWRFMRVGTLNLFPSLLATLIGLLAASVLAGPETARRRKRK